ncbi:granzyme-like protein 2 [Anableps anableps]
MLTYCTLAALMLVLNVKVQVDAGKIIGGHKVAAHSRPYMVLLAAKIGNGRTKHCGGFLVREDFVMTAAHCKAKSYTVFLGLHSNHDKNYQTLSVKEEFKHGYYDEHNYRNDIMLLKLSSKAKLNNNVKLIALADKSDVSVPKSCIVSGWGQTNLENKNMSLTLMEANVTLIENEMCTMEKVYCSKGDTGPGQGDSGGPLVCEGGKAYGLVSASRELPSGSMLYKYTMIPDYSQWINSIMKNNSSSF